MKRKHPRALLPMLTLNLILLVLLNGVLPCTLYLTGLVRETYQIVLVLAGIAVFSFLFIYRDIRRTQKSIETFRRFFERGRTQENRIDADGITFREGSDIAARANAMMDEWQQESKKYRDTEARYRDIVQSVATGILEFNQNGDVLFCNRYAEKIFGYSAEELMGKRTIGKLNPEEDSTGLKHWDLLTKIFAHPEAYAYNENENRTKDGRRIWVAWRNRIITDSEGKQKSILCLANDITDQKKNHELLQKSLEEKKTLLKEIHHRIKNNLQIIASILNLQKDYPDTGGNILAECENRIIAMSIVHEQLFESENLSTIDAAWYIAALTDHIIESSSGRESTIETILQVEAVELDIDTAIPLGLIMNELVTNSVRHGFENRTSGTISISLRRSDGILFLTVADNGKGLTEETDLSSSPTLGLKLVTSLVEQLSGTMTRTGPPGISWNFQFPFTGKMM